MQRAKTLRWTMLSRPATVQLWHTCKRLAPLARLELGGRADSDCCQGEGKARDKAEEEKAAAKAALRQRRLRHWKRRMAAARASLRTKEDEWRRQGKGKEVEKNIVQKKVTTKALTQLTRRL